MKLAVFVLQISILALFSNDIVAELSHDKGGIGLCGCFGDPHCKSFDGKWAHYQNTCLYTMVRDQCQGTVSSSGVPTFEVSVHFWDKDRLNSKVIWVKEVFITIGDTKFEIHQNINVKKNGETVIIPYMDPDGGIVIDKFGKYITLHYIPSGLKVHFDGVHNFEVYLPDNFDESTCGMCGNRNRNMDDDWQLGPACKSPENSFLGPLTTNINAFGVSWTDLAYAADHPYCIDCDIKPPPEPCTDDEKSDAEDVCADMYFENDAPIKKCWSELTEEQKEGFMNACVYDYCNAGEDTICDIFNDYAGFCLDNYLILEEEWGPYENCEPSCDNENEEYLKCGYRTQDRTCYEVLATSIPDLDDQCVSGCFCKEGYVRNSGQKCIRPENCGCVYEYITMEKDDYYFDKDNCVLVKCNGDNEATIIDAKDCGENAECKRINEDEITCECNEGYIYDGEGCIEACEAGTYSETGYQECTPCFPGSFQSVTGMTNCTACPAGQTTLHSGSTSEDDCVG